MQTCHPSPEENVEIGKKSLKMCKYFGENLEYPHIKRGERGLRFGDREICLKIGKLAGMCSVLS